VLLIVFAACVLAEDISSADRVAAINAKAQGWQATATSVFAGKSVEDVSALFVQVDSEVEDEVNTRVASYFTRQTMSNAARARLHDCPSCPPREFDARKAYPGCVGEVFDQGRCGACWAVASLKSWEDRVCIANTKAGEPGRLQLSVLDVLVNANSNGCQGGDSEEALAFLTQQGVVSQSCLPYGSWESGPIPTCPNEPCLPETFVKTPAPTHKCSNPDINYTEDKLKLAGFGSVSGEEAIIKQLATEGPGIAWFQVFDDFLNYHSGVYTPTSKRVLGNHITKLVGYGEENGRKYWLVQNSWTSKWGDAGFFKIARGINACGIESNMHFPKANVERAARGKAVA
jgi:cathepsin B